MGKKRDHEVAARIAWAARKMLGDSAHIPASGDEQGWTLYEVAVTAINEYASHMYEKSR